MYPIIRRSIVNATTASKLLNAVAGVDTLASHVPLQYYNQRFLQTVSNMNNNNNNNNNNVNEINTQNMAYDDWDDDDEELRKAIQKSLQPPSPPSMQVHSNVGSDKEIICLDSDPEEDNEDIKLVAANAKAQLNSTTTTSTSNFGGLPISERKGMEQERLARLSKGAGHAKIGVKSLKRSIDDVDSPGGSSSEASSSLRPTKTLKTGAIPLSQFYGRASAKPNFPEQTFKENTKPRFTLGEEILPDDGIRLQYPNGAVKRTFLEGVQRTCEDVTIEEVLQRGTLTMAVLSAFMWDPDWILNKVDVRTTSLILVMHAKDNEERERLKKMFSVLTGIKLVFPDMSGQISCMHSKLMLLFHKNYLRVVVPTANLVKFDWGGMNGVMENTVFLLDLPRIPKNQRGPLDPSELTNFAKELIYFCKKKGYPDNIMNALHYIDYSKTVQLAFVHSIGGSHQNDDWKRTGYPGLAAAVRGLGLQSGKGLSVDYVTSSVGALNREFLTNIYRAVMGDNGYKELQSRGKKQVQNNRLTFAPASTAASSSSKSDNDPANTQLTWEDIKDRFRVYFPTQETVKNSKGGPAAGGTVCFQRKWWDGQTFPKEVLWDCVSTRAKVLMHSKLLFARPAQQLKTANGLIDAYAYVGSANLSESAWGKLVMDRATKSPKLNVKNWECGVLIPVIASKAKSDGINTGTTILSGKVEQEAAAAVAVAAVAAPPVPLTVFNGVVPVPMEVPAKRIAAGRTPWFYLDT